VHPQSFDYAVGDLRRTGGGPLYLVHLLGEAVEVIDLWRRSGCIHRGFAAYVHTRE
jgi:hypothetical protein